MAAGKDKGKCEIYKGNDGKLFWSNSNRHFNERQ